MVKRQRKLPINRLLHKYGVVGSRNKKLEEVQQKVLENSLNRQFLAQQQNYLKELESKQKAEIREIKRKAKKDLENIRNNVNIQLEAAKILPPEDSVTIVYPTGQREVASKKLVQDTLSDAAEVKRLKEEIKELKGEEQKRAQKELDTLEEAARLREKAQKDLEADRYFYNTAVLERISGTEYYLKKLVKFLGADINKIKSFSDIKANYGDTPEYKALIRAAETTALPPEKKQDSAEAQQKRFEGLIKKAKQLKKGGGEGPGLYSDQIEKYMQPLQKLGWLGVYMSDQIRDISPKEIQKRGALILNSQPEFDGKGNENPGQHWCALFWDLRHENEGDYTMHFNKSPHAQTVFFYNPFGIQASDGMLKDIRVFVDKIIKKYDIDYQVMFQYNDCKHQDLRSYQCGYFCMAWVLDMMHGFNPHKACCNHEYGTREAEKDVKKFEKDFDAGRIPKSQILG